jgi:hypothetical protein
VARHDVWYSDTTSGFYVLHLEDAAWPAPPAEAKTGCTPLRRLTIYLPRSLRRASVRYAGRKATAVRRRGRVSARLNLSGVRARTVLVRVTGRTRQGRTVHLKRRYKICR